MCCFYIGATQERVTNACFLVLCPRKQTRESASDELPPTGGSRRYFLCSVIGWPWLALQRIYADIWHNLLVAMLMLLTTNLCLICSPRCYHPLIKCCHPSFYGILSLNVFLCRDLSTDFDSGSCLKCISPRCRVVSSFVFLLPPLEVGWYDVAWRELCSFVPLLPSSFPPLPLIEFIYVDWVPAEASFVYCWRYRYAVKRIFSVLVWQLHGGS